jgi:hypothetical protein
MTTWISTKIGDSFQKYKKKSFRKNYSEIYTTDYSFGKTSERLVRQPLDNLKSRGDFCRSKFPKKFSGNFRSSLDNIFDSFELTSAMTVIDKLIQYHKNGLP